MLDKNMASYWKPACFLYLCCVHLVILYIEFGTSKELGFKLQVSEHSLMSIRPTAFHGICLLGIWTDSGSFRMMHYILTKNTTAEMETCQIR